MKDDRIEIRIPSDLKEKLQQQAQSNGLTLSVYLAEILTEKGKDFIYCPVCNLPVFEKSRVPVIGPAQVKCCCGHVWQHNF
jgi:hypothetical protein